MLKTTEEQPNSLPDVYLKDRLARTVGAQTPRTTTGDDVIETQELENINALVGEFTIAEKRSKRTGWVIWGVMVGSILPLLGLILFLNHRLPHGHWLLQTLTALQVLITLLGCIGFASSLASSAKQKFIIHRLTASNDVRVISPLLSLPVTRNIAARRRLIGGALTSLLPRLTERDSTWLTDDDKKRIMLLAHRTKSGLMRKLYGDGWVDLAVAVLRAIGEVADSRALATVTALANSDATTDDLHRIHQAAIDCLVPLRKRIERDRIGQHLLRSSGAPKGESDTLLIPAVKNVDGDVRELPRASGSDVR